MRPIATRRLELVTALAIVGLDQATKAALRPRLALHESLEIVPGLLNLTRVHNTGAAFGLLDAADFPLKPVVLTLVAIAAFSAVAWYALTVPPSDRLARVGVACVLGGAVGNLIDRVAYGYVLDFVDVYWRGWHFWAFNAADASITIGVGLLILDMLRTGRRASHPA